MDKTNFLLHLLNINPFVIQQILAGAVNIFDTMKDPENKPIDRLIALPASLKKIIDKENASKRRRLSSASEVADIIKYRIDKADCSVK